MLVGGWKGDSIKDFNRQGTKIEVMKESGVVLVPHPCVSLCAMVGRARPHGEGPPTTDPTPPDPYAFEPEDDGVGWGGGEEKAAKTAAAVRSFLRRAAFCVPRASLPI